MNEKPKEVAASKDCDAKVTRKHSGRRPRNRKEGVPSFKPNDGYFQKPGNDFDFWNAFPELMNIATKLPWMHIQGTSITGSNIEVEPVNVLVQEYYPVPGVSLTATAPINVMFRDMYLDMHRRYRGIGAYQAADICISVLCIESANQLVVEAERIYGILNSYPVRNRIAPDGLLKALGWNQNFITNVKNNMADYRYKLNRIITKLQRLPLPKGMSFFRNHVSLNAFIYTDSKDYRAAFLAFNPIGYFRYAGKKSEGAINNAGTAVFERLDRSTYSSYSTYLTFVESIIDILLSDDDILKITSDFIACYGLDQMQSLLPLPEDYKVAPMYDEAILSKFHNSERLGSSTARLGYGAGDNTTKIDLASVSSDFFRVYQENNVVISWPVLLDVGSGAPKKWMAMAANTNFPGSQASIPGVYYPTDHIADSWQENPDEATVCEAMLWKPNGIEHKLKIDGFDYYATSIGNVCTELLAGLKTYSVVNGDAALNVAFFSTYSTSSTDYQASGLYHFDWHPLILKYNPSNHTVTSIMGDVDNLTVVSNADISKIVDAASLSAFKVTVQFKNS